MGKSVGTTPAPIGDVFTFCCGQSIFPSRLTLYKITVQLKFFIGYTKLQVYKIFFVQVFQLAALVVRGPSDLPVKFTGYLDIVRIDHQEFERAIACVRSPLFTQKKLLLRVRVYHAGYCRILCKLNLSER